MQARSSRFLPPQKKEAEMQHLPARRVVSLLNVFHLTEWGFSCNHPNAGSGRLPSDVNAGVAGLFHANDDIPDMNEMIRH
jgi:hypothetical protein